MKNNKEFLYNLYIIIILILIDFGWGIIMKGSNKLSLEHGVLLTLTYSISFFSIYFLNYYYFLPHFLNKKKYVWFSFSIILMILLFAGIRFLLEEIISPALFNLNNYNLKHKNITFIYLTDSFIYALKACLYSSVIYLLFRNNEHKDALHKLNIQHQKAQLTTLKSQLSPHFLFNTLNNFYAELYDEKPETAHDILKLSQLLRYVTYETSDDYVSLEKEIQFIKDYVYFFKRRYENNLHLTLQINGAIIQQRIPSLILIHFVENVCKHGIINNINKPAKIIITVTSHSLEITTENYINKAEKYMESGIGTQNIQKRLEVIFKDNFILESNEDDLIFKTYLKLPL